MFPKTLHFSALKLTKLLIQIPILPSILHQRSNLSSLSHNNPSNTSLRQRIMKHKDWLSTADTVKIFDTLEDPNIALEVLNIISERKDYNPNQEIYSAVLKQLALAEKFDFVDALIEKIKFENRCKLSEEFFYDVIKVYGVLGGRINKAIYTLYDMPSYECLPSYRSFNLVLNLLVNTKQFEIIHEVFLKATELRVAIDACSLNILIKGLCKCGKFEAAFDVLKEFGKHGLRPNVKTFSTIMNGLCKRGRVDEALAVFDRMEKEGIEADTVAFNIMIKGLRKKGRIQEGIDLVDRMLFKGCTPYASTDHEVLYCLLDAKRFVEAKELMGRMSGKNVRPTIEAYVAVLKGFCIEKNVENVDWALHQMVWHQFIPKRAMWEKVVKCVLSGSETSFSSFNNFPYKEIIGQ